MTCIPSQFSCRYRGSDIAIMNSGKLKILKYFANDVTCIDEQGQRIAPSIVNTNRLCLLERRITSVSESLQLFT